MGAHCAFLCPVWLVTSPWARGTFLHPSFCPVLYLPAEIHLLVLLSDYWSATIPWVDSMALRALVDLGHIALRGAHTHSRISIQPRTIAFCLSSAVGVPVPRSATAMPSYAVCCTGLWSMDWLPSLTSDLPSNSRTCLVVTSLSKTPAAITRIDLY